MKSKLVKQVNETIRTHQLFSTDSKILVALSGGADSVSLLLVLQELGYQIEALHCNFHLRQEESDRDERFVRALCDKYSIPLHVKQFQTSEYCKIHKISIEMGARELRYAWFNEMLNMLHAQAICVAHHQQDQAETLLLNLIRGTGLRGLAGMHYRHGSIIRPMLDCTRKDILYYLQEKKQEWVEDSTNAEREAIRNRIRLDILPMLQTINPQAISNIAQTASIVQESLPIYERGLRGNDISTLTELHEYVNGYGFNSTQERDIWKAESGSMIESATHRLLKDRDRFILQEKQQPSLTNIQTKVIQRKDIVTFQKDNAYFDNALVQRPLQVRFVKNGDRFSPFGMKGTKLVSDLLTDLKMNRFEKERQCVLCDAKGNIIWVIGRRASNLYKVSEQTQEVLVASLDQV